MQNNSNECVNVRENHREEIHKYVIGDTHFNVRAVNKNDNPRLIYERLKVIVKSHVNCTDTKN